MKRCKLLQRTLFGNGTKRTSISSALMFAFGGKADIGRSIENGFGYRNKYRCEPSNQHIVGAG